MQWFPTPLYNLIPLTSCDCTVERAYHYIHGVYSYMDAEYGLWSGDAGTRLRLLKFECGENRENKMDWKTIIIRVKESTSLLNTIWKRKGNWVWHIKKEKRLLTTVLEGTVEEKRKVMPMWKTEKHLIAVIGFNSCFKKIRTSVDNAYWYNLSSL